MTKKFRTLWLLCALFIVYGTTIPFRLTTDRAFIVEKWSRVSLNPLVSAETGRHLSIPDVVQNVLLFVPFGVFGLLAGRRRTGFGVLRILFVTGLATVLSAAVEALQLFTLDRVTSATDIMTNTTGALIGAVGAQIARQASARMVRRLVGAGAVDVRTFYPLMIAAIVLCVGAWQPFDVTLDVGTLISKVRALQRDVWQFGPLTDEGVASLRFALFAVASCEWLEAMGMRGAAVWGACIGLVAAAGLEASQITISARQPGLEDAAVEAAGVVVGVVLWTVGRRSAAGGFRWVWLALVVAATAAGAAMQMLSPFTWSPVYRSYGWLPFFGYYQHTTFDTLSHVIELLLIYFPLGFCFAQASMSTRTQRVLGAALAVTLVIAAPIEYCQGWIVGRYPDVTDVGFSLVGAGIGAWSGGPGAAIFRRAVAVLG